MRRLSKNEIARWERTRSQGKWRYVAVRAFIWTVLAVIGMSQMDSIHHLYLFVLFGPGVGLLGGLSQWWINEGNYQDSIQNQMIARALGPDYDGR
jgi:hypothetical protein